MKLHLHLYLSLYEEIKTFSQPNSPEESLDQLRYLHSQKKSKC